MHLHFDVSGGQKEELLTDSRPGVWFLMWFLISLSLSKFFKNVQFYLCVCAHAHVGAVTCIWRSVQLVEVDFHHVKSMGLIQIATSTM